MKIAQRYLAANFILPFVVGTLFFVCFLLIFQLFRLIDLVINKSVPAHTVLEMIFHTAVSFFPMAFPLASLFAALFTLGKLSEDSEIVAMRSFGLSKHSLFFPFFAVGLMISAMIYTLNAELIPHSRGSFRNMLIRLGSDGMLTDIRSEVFFTEIPRITLFAQHVHEDGERMEEVFLHMRDPEQGERVIHASRGALIKQSRGEWLAPALRFYLEDGNMVRTDQGSGEVEEIQFKEYDFPINMGNVAQDFVTRDSMMTNAELRAELEGYRKTLARPRLREDRRQQTLQDYNRTKMEYFSRINTPLQCMVFIFLGFSLGIKKGRGNSGRFSTVMSLGTLLLYYAVFFTGASFVKKGTLDPLYAVFGPSVLVLLLTIYFYKRLDWQS
jgi:lipopolysaccharide export system permease protein